MLAYTYVYSVYSASVCYACVPSSKAASSFFALSALFLNNMLGYKLGRVFGALLSKLV